LIKSDNMAEVEPKVEDEMVGGEEEEGNDEVRNALQWHQAVR